MSRIRESKWRFYQIKFMCISPIKAGYEWLHFHWTDKQNQWKLAMITKFNFMFLSAFIC